MSASRSLYLPEILLADDHARTGIGLLVDDRGLVEGFCSRHLAPAKTEIVPLNGKALLPGLANAHSHTFQRLFRGHAESRVHGGDSFWTWREQMYRAAAFVSPEDIYDVARATFFEMVAAGITAVGEFHYLHGDNNGQPYSNANLLSHQVIAAAQSVGLRICLLRSAYFRAGFEREPHPGQRRFYEDPEDYLRNLDDLRRAYCDEDRVSIGAAPHSIRAVPLENLKQISNYAASQGPIPMHLHISEQVAENAACLSEYGRTPVELIGDHGILSTGTTLIHAIHLTSAEFAEVAKAGSTICSCPTTERNLGDGIFPGDVSARLGIPVAFGTDSQAQIDILEDARQIEYHLRLRNQQRGILEGALTSSLMSTETIGTSLFCSASSNGYRALGISGGKLSKGQPADFFTVDLNDLSVLGLAASGLSAESFKDQIVFALSKSAVRDVAVNGRLILEDGQHREAEDIRSRYKAVQLRYLQHTIRN